MATALLPYLGALLALCLVAPTMLTAVQGASTHVERSQRQKPQHHLSAGPIDCDNGTSFCPTGSQCCKAQYSPSHWGCMQNSSCCTLGPHNAPSTTLPNCIVLGDSVSIGYTPDVIRMLNGTCAVQHTPWDVSDGGAGSTSYSLDCLDFFLVTAAQKQVEWDVIFFNFGLHNLNNASAAEDLYSQQLTTITQRLSKAGKTLVYGLTTPFMPDYLLGNHVVEDLNARAQKIVSSQQPAIPVVDLYDVVVKKCGPLPYVNCTICRKEPCSYHYNTEGSQLLATAVSAGIKSALVAEPHAKAHHEKKDGGHWKLHHV